MLNTRFFPLVFHSPKKATDFDVLQRKLFLKFPRKTVGGSLAKIDVAARKKRIVSSGEMRKKHMTIQETDSSREIVKIAQVTSWV